MPTAVVYFADDDRGMRYVYEDVTCPVKDGSKWKVQTFAYAELLLETVERQKPDVVMTDVDFGPMNMDGLTLTALLKEKYPKIKIIVTSGTPQIRPKAIQAGADEFIAKPWDLEALEALIQKLLQSRET